ncbi:unnamed protein product [Blepharisma stoltei]|uniref:Uncharacterized protein n=1 Tax=Blepharisma stoltei TaxID=1481888 RepID=A0AAU9J9D6_9CILI|nr:unnamed protein product [Blepharisma stoltei]
MHFSKKWRVYYISCSWILKRYWIYYSKFNKKCRDCLFIVIFNSWLWVNELYQQHFYKNCRRCQSWG